VIVVPMHAGLALVLAILVNAKIRGANFFRTVHFLPVVTSIVVVSLL
jgi:multiple sugar transport system permease protein